MSESRTPMSGAERMRKHREENQLRTGLSQLKQQLKRSQLLASGTPEGDRMKKDAKERKRLHKSQEHHNQVHQNTVTEQNNQ